MYQTFNALPADLLYRDGGEGTKDHEVDWRRWLLVDVDPKRLAGMSATDEERERAREVARTIMAYLRKQGWSDPFAFDSGNGFHLLYRIDLPNDAEAEKLVKGALEGLAWLFNTEEAAVDTAVSNASRITRVYGTKNRKGKDDEKRPHRCSRMISRGGDGVVTAAQLEEMAPPVPEEPKGRGRHRIRPTEVLDVPDWLEKQCVPVKRSGPYQGGHRWILEECSEQGHTDNSAYIIQFPSGGISAGCSHNSCRGGRGDNAWHDWRAHFQPGWEPYEERSNGHHPNGYQDERTANTANTANEFEDLRDLPDPDAFPLEALPPTVRKFTRQAAKSVGCPVDYVGVSVLAAVSAAIGDTRRLVIKRDWSEGAALYAMIVGGPASKKSPAMNLVLKPVRKQQMDLKAEYDRQKGEYETALENWKKQDNPDPEDKPKKPVMGRTYADDTTVERLADILNENPRGLLIIKDELSGWLGSMNAYKQGGKGADRQFWLSAHTNQPIAVDRKSVEEPVIVAHPFVSIIGGIQPEVLPDFGQDRGDGLIDRFIAAHPEPRLSRWTDDEVSEESAEAYHGLIKRLYRLEHARHDGDTFASRVHMTDDAKALFVQQYDALHVELESPGFPQRLRPAWGKLEAYLARFALILAMTRIAEAEEKGHGPREQVTREDMEGATRLLAYFKNHAKRVYTGLYGDNTADKLAADLRDFLISCEGQWEGSASELFEAFESEHKPDRDKDLGKAVRAIAKRSPLLRIEDLPRKTTLRRFRLFLENVGSVGSVGSSVGVSEDEDVEAEVTI